MKFRHQTRGDTNYVELAGDLVSADCTCLRSFWERNVGDDLPAIEIDLTAVDSMDSESVAVLTELVRDHVATGAEVTLHQAPQMLAHTLYKIGLLDHAGLTLVDPRSDEQHAT